MNISMIARWSMTEKYILKVDSFMEIEKSLGLAVIQIYMVLAAQFESFIYLLKISKLYKKIKKNI